MLDISDLVMLGTSICFFLYMPLYFSDIYLCFWSTVIFPRHVEGKKLDRTVWNLSTFHAYVNYHVKVKFLLFKWISFYISSCPLPGSLLSFAFNWWLYWNSFSVEGNFICSTSWFAILLEFTFFFFR